MLRAALDPADGGRLRGRVAPMSAVLSDDQQRVLVVLAGAGGRLQTIEVIRAARSTEMRHGADPAGYRCVMASTSRTLARLRARGLVDLWLPQLCRQGKGGWWTITAAGRDAVSNAPTLGVANRSAGRAA